MMFVGEYVTGKPYAKPDEPIFSLFLGENCSDVAIVIFLAISQGNSKRFAKAKGRVPRKWVLA